MERRRSLQGLFSDHTGLDSFQLLFFWIELLLLGSPCQLTLVIEARLNFPHASYKPARRSQTQPPGHPLKIAKNVTRYSTVTSMATPKQRNPLFQEDRLILALNAHKQGQFLSFRSAVKI